MIRFAATILTACLLVGCADDPRQGYSFESTYGASVKSIAVPIFDNRSYSHGLEIDLTDAIIKELRRGTPWAVGAESAAQTTLSGTITSVVLRKVSTAQVSGLVQEVAVEIVLDYEWKDNRTGEVLLSRRGFRSVQSFVPAEGVGERVELGERAAAEEAAREIVSSLRSGW